MDTKKYSYVVQSLLTRVLFSELLSTAVELRTKIEKVRSRRHEATEDVEMEIQSSALANGNDLELHF